MAMKRPTESDYVISFKGSENKIQDVLKVGKKLNLTRTLQFSAYTNTYPDYAFNISDNHYIDGYCSEEWYKKEISYYKIYSYKDFLGSNKILKLKKEMLK